ncbi:MAG: hypothetical protein ACXVFN_20840 [Solirubrobacteraceae bacterium]
MAPARALAVVVVAALVAGCGGGGKSPTATTTATTTTQARTAPDPLLPPARVPQKATGPADPASVRVIEGWSRALRGGHIARAARYFSLPSKFQNATPVLTIDLPAERIAINRALPCGAVPTKLGGAGAFTIVTFRLVERVGGACGNGVGATARSAIRVANHQIREWYRLPDAPAPTPSPTSTGPVV